MGNFKLQSAVEYLTTYGWAILILAIILAIVYTGASDIGNPLPSACEANPGFLCENPVLSHAGGTCSFGPCSTFSFFIGQETGQSWTSANIYFITESNVSTVNSLTGAPLQISQQPTHVVNDLTAGLFNEQQTGITIFSPSNSANFNAGQEVAGEIWAQYTLAQTGSHFYYVDMAQVNLKAA